MNPWVNKGGRRPVNVANKWHVTREDGWKRCGKCLQYAPPEAYLANSGPNKKRDYRCGTCRKKASVKSQANAKAKG